MKDFMMALIFSKMVLLTASPISIFDGVYSIYLDKPISAVTSGASLQLDVTSMVLGVDFNDILEIRREVKRLFPSGSISANLIGRGVNTELLYDGNTFIGGRKVYLSLTGNIPVSTEWNRVTIDSDINLKNVLIEWKNYKNQVKGKCNANNENWWLFS
ncbi:hypothetical protein [Dongshaea marina]|uniref:hypothetical protein n=1 Tax=Dongshaea marina TaxID=2047966 RepID=UPI000D3E02BD|nr:hypothetical protein [Dongshaea marina]